MLKKILVIFAIFQLCTSLSASSTEKLQDFFLSSLKEEEVHQDWVKEYKMGLAFAQKGEFDLALHSLKRGLILIPNTLETRFNEVQYAVLLTHYLKQDYKQVIETFEGSPLLYVSSSFAFHHDLMLLLYESYEKTDEFKKADHLLAQIQKAYPSEGEELILTQALIRKDIEQVKHYSTLNPKRSYLVELSDNYMDKLKSPKIAKWLGVLCPGAGYLYAGQPKTALTSFLVNGLLIAASTQLFVSHLYTLGVVVATFEAGWYVGGILGGKEATKTYNNWVYQDFQSKVIMQENLIVGDQLSYEF